MQEKQLKLFFGGTDSQPYGFGEDEASFLDFEGLHEGKLEERMSHLSDTFSDVFNVSDSGKKDGKC